MDCEINEFIDSLPSNLDLHLKAHEALLKIKADLNNNIFHPIFSRFVMNGGTPDEIRQEILASDFLIDLERLAAEKLNFYSSWVDHMDPEPTLYFKRKQRVPKSVSFAELPLRTGLILPPKPPKKPHPHTKPSQIRWYQTAAFDLNPRATH
jgi:hypothetical protein